MALAQVRFHQVRLREALASADRAVALDPSAALAHKDRAEILLTQGKVKEAAIAMRRAVALDPLMPVVHARHVDHFHGAGPDRQRPCQHPPRHRARPENPFWYFTLANQFALKGQRDSASPRAAGAWWETNRVVTWSMTRSSTRPAVRRCWRSSALWAGARTRCGRPGRRRCTTRGWGDRFGVRPPQDRSEEWPAGVLRHDQLAVDGAAQARPALGGDRGSDAAAMSAARSPVVHPPRMRSWRPRSPAGVQSR